MAKEVIAPMPGKVLDVLVKIGDEVLEYQDVLVLEAMKMENTIPSSHKGRVKEISVQKGETVSTQQVLIVLD
jgi:biotin carboxyl carrier protein